MSCDWRSLLISGSNIPTCGDHTSGHFLVDPHDGLHQLNCARNAGIQEVFNRIYREQIEIYGAKLSYTQAEFNLNVDRFKIRGQDHVTPFTVTREIWAYPSDPNIQINLLTVGYMDMSTIRLFIHKQSFYEVFGQDQIPKAGDLFKIPCLNDDTWEITFRDEAPAPNANMLHYYTWTITAARYMNSQRNSVPYDGNTDIDGNISDQPDDTATIDTMSDEIYDFIEEGNTEEIEVYGHRPKLPGLEDLL